MNNVALAGTPPDLSGSIPYLASGVSAIALAAYLGAVVYQGNVSALMGDLYNDRGYLEFVIGLFIIYQLMTFAPTSELSTGLFVLALIGVLLKFASAINSQTISDFMNGKIGLYDLMARISAVTSSVGFDNMPTTI
jgi:hypothetical protein